MNWVHIASSCVSFRSILLFHQKLMSDVVKGPWLHTCAHLCDSVFDFEQPSPSLKHHHCGIGLLHRSHSATFCNRNVHMCAHFCYKMVHYGIFVKYIVGFVRWIHCSGVDTILRLGGTYTQKTNCFIIGPGNNRLNIKTVLSTYGDFHVKDKTAVRTSYL